MLSSKTLTRLILICSLCAFGVGYFVWQAAKTKHNNGLFLPGLLKEHEQIAQVVIENGQHKLTIIRGVDNWQIAERGNYPVLREKVEELLFALADLEIVEPKTANPENFKQLGVEDIETAPLTTTQISVLDKQNNTLAKVIIGNHEGMANGDDYQEFICIRKAGDLQSWLVRGTLPFSVEFSDWVEQPLLGLIEAEQLKLLSVLKPKNDKVIISRKSSKQEDFTLSSFKPKKGRTLDLDAVNTLPFTVAELEFIDAIPSTTQGIDWQNSVQARLETFAGITIGLSLIKQDDKVLAKVSASAAVDAPRDVQAKVEAFNALKSPWYYQLSEEAYNEITAGNSTFMKAA